MTKNILVKLFLLSMFGLSFSTANAQCESAEEMYFAGSSSFCPGGRAQISIIGDFVSYEWDNDWTANPFMANEAGIYTVTVTDNLGCTASSAIEVIESSNLELIIGGPEVACNVDSIRLYSGYGFVSYQWDSGETEADITVYQSGTYAVHIEDQVGCMGTGTIAVIMENDMVAPTIVTCPTDLAISIGPNESCDNSNPNIIAAIQFPLNSQWTALEFNTDFPGTATDNSSNPLVIEYKDEFIQTNCSAGSNLAFVIERIWRISDICGNTTECIQSIKLSDNNPPVILDGENFFYNQDLGNPDGPFVISSIFCPTDVTWLELTESDIFDNCTTAGNIQIFQSHTPGSDFDEGITSVSYILEDECGNSTEYIFDINVSCLGCTDTDVIYSNCSDPPTVCDLNTLDNFSSCTPEYEGTEQGAFCSGGVLNNPSFFNFIAGANTATITIIPDNCTTGDNLALGLQANVTLPCNSLVCFGSSGDDCYDTAFTFDVQNLEEGEEYQLVIDGCGGSECLYTIEVDFAEPFTIDALGEFNTTLPGSLACVNSQDTYCTGTEILFYPENYLDSEIYFCWNVDNLNGVVALNESSNCVSAPGTSHNCNADFSSCGPILLAFNQPGVYNVCLDELANGCDQESYPNYCYEIIIEESNDVFFGTYDVCASNMPWEPLFITGVDDEPWQGTQALQAGTNTNLITDDCGCSYNQVLVVNVIPEFASNTFVDICKEDLTSFTDPDLGLDWSDILPHYNATSSTATVNIANGSQQAQFDGTLCDSTINYQFFIYDIQGELTQMEGPDCNTSLTFEIDQSNFPSFMFESNIIYKWFDPAGSLIDNTNSINVSENGLYTLELSYIIPNGNACEYIYEQNVFGASTMINNYYQDADNDGFGLTANVIADCVQPLGYVLNDGDCNDNNPNIYPGAPEIENNGIDENCDGMDTVIGVDNDNDGFTDDVDCDDEDPNINPTAEEIPNNLIDEDCDGAILVIDLDGDGYNSDEDCDDLDPEINPEAEEIANNDVDENCDGNIIVIDDDMDGWNSDEDCDDSNADINPGSEEIPNNTVDENCDGLILIIDEDMDGWNSDLDCDDTNENINPGSIEIPNNDVDEDCDGLLLIIDLDGDGWNSDEDCNDDDPLINPEAEEIPDNEVDENCDGIIEVTDAVYTFNKTVISIYPNPAKDHILIETNDPINYEIFTLNGISIQKKDAFLYSNRIDISHLPTGVYFIVVEINGGADRITEKIIKI